MDKRGKSEKRKEKKKKKEEDQNNVKDPRNLPNSLESSRI